MYALHSDAQTLAAGNLAADGRCVAAQVTSQGVVLFGSGAPEAASAARYVWRPPPGGRVGAAAVADAALLLFCTGGGGRQLVVLLPSAPARDGGAGRAAGDVLELVQAAALPLACEASCISGLLPLPGRPGAAVLAVGTYSSSVLLIQLQLGQAQQPGQPPAAALLPLQRLDLSATSAAAAAAAAAAVCRCCMGAPGEAEECGRGAAAA